MKLKCPKCGFSEFNADAEKKGIYVCNHTLEETGCYCETIVAALCKQCCHIYPFDGFGKHGDVYECKECGKVNWPLTEYIREVEEIKAKWEDIGRRSREFQAMMMAEVNKLNR